MDTYDAKSGGPSDREDDTQRTGLSSGQYDTHVDPVRVRPIPVGILKFFLKLSEEKCQRILCSAYVYKLITDSHPLLKYKS